MGASEKVFFGRKLLSLKRQDKLFSGGIDDEPFSGRLGISLRPECFSFCFILFGVLLMATFSFLYISVVLIVVFMSVFFFFVYRRGGDGGLMKAFNSAILFLCFFGVS